MTEDNLTGRTAKWYLHPGRAQNVGQVVAHRGTIVSVHWSRHCAGHEASNWSEKEVNYFVFMGWLVFGPPREDDDDTP